MHYHYLEKNLVLIVFDNIIRSEEQFIPSGIECGRDKSRSINCWNC